MFFKNEKRWYNDMVLLCQLLIIPPIFFYGLWKNENIRKGHKILLGAGAVILIVVVLLCLYFFI